MVLYGSIFHSPSPPISPTTPNTPLFGGAYGNLVQMPGLTSILTAAGTGESSSYGYLGDSMRLFLLGTVIETGRRFCYWLIERFRFRYSMTARFSEGDPAYEWIILFLTEKGVWRRSRDFWVNSKTSVRKWGIKPGVALGEEVITEHEESSDYVPIYEIPQLFYWNGYWLEIHCEQGPLVSRPPNHIGTSFAILYLTIYTLDISVLKDLMDEARRRYVEVSKRNVIIHSASLAQATEGIFWGKVKSKACRPLSSIILPEGELESLVEDARDFIDSEDWYTEAGIPHRRGYLLYGPPGTGKSSTIYALAGELGLEIFISLSSEYLNDTLLQATASAIPKRSILLIEDIDCAFPSREDEDEQMNDSTPLSELSIHQNLPRRTAVTMSGLLNIIDGVNSEEGRFFIATTNYIDRLDEALLRPGRIDRKIRYTLATTAQACALYTRFFSVPRFENAMLHDQSKALDLQALADEFASGVPEEDFSVAELQGYLLLYKKRPVDAAKGIRAWVAKEYEERRAKKEREEQRKQKLKAAKEKREVKSGLGLGAFGDGISAHSPFGPSFRNETPVDVTKPTLQSQTSDDEATKSDDVMQIRGKVLIESNEHSSTRPVSPV